MINLLYICRSFAPVNNIASIRHSKLVKYFVRNGLNVTVIAENLPPDIIQDPMLLSDEYKKITLLRLPIHKSEKKIYINKNQKIFRNKNEFVLSLKRLKCVTQMLSYIRDVIYDLRFFNSCRKNMTLIENQRNFDIIISSYRPFGAHWSAYYLYKNQKKKCFWIADFRDLPNDSKIYPEIIKPLNNLIQAIVCNKADIVTTISNGLRERLSKKIWIKKNQNLFHTITNGFDSEDQNFINYVRKKNDKFIICYTGHIIEGKRDASLLFDSISELIKINVITKSSINLLFAGPQFSYQLLLQQSKKFNLEEIVINMGYLLHHQILELQKESDLLLLLTSNNKNESGILTGKFFEYVGSKRPIIALITGNLIGSEITRIITEYKVGYSFYYKNYDEAKIELSYKLKEFIYLKLQLGEINDIQNENILSFSYSEITKKILNLYEKYKSP
jgi:hypothetical protein